MSEEMLPTALRGILPAAATRPVRVWGIDLGTTNSTVTEISWDPASRDGPLCSTLDLDQPTTAGSFTGPLVPSVVAVAPDGAVWVGEGAKRLRSRPYEASLVPMKTLFYETKNDMGLRKTYVADEPFDHAHKIAGHILRFLMDQAEGVTGAKPDRVVVTVPASFQLNQRRDTLQAAELAGIPLQDYDLLDEPVAALLDYLMQAKGEAFAAGSRIRAVVFDFGGGTCDVAVVELELDPASQRLSAAARTVSRYHRLGGGDLDAAIVHEALLPALLRENSLDPLELSWAEKKKILEPQLLGTAEALKLALCKEIDRSKKFRRYETERESLMSRQPSITCRIGSRELHLSHPELSAATWERILEPFLDQDSLYQRDTEYRLIQSIFAPLDDALTRGGLDRDDIDLVLLAGGSTRIPAVREAVSNFFVNARTEAFPDDFAAQMAVSRGAAWHALFLQTAGRPFLQPIIFEQLSLLTEGGGILELVPARSPVPFPPDGVPRKLTGLVIPTAGVCRISLEVVTEPNRRAVLKEHWDLPGIALGREQITVEVTLSSNQAFKLEAYLTDHPTSRFSQVVENPLMTVVDPGESRLRIEELEERLRASGGSAADDGNAFTELAQKYAELQQYERAIQHISTALRLAGRPDAVLLNLQGIYYGELGDVAREEKAYRAADQVSPRWGGPMFNLTLALSRRNDYENALVAVRAALTKYEDGPTRTLEASCLQRLGRESDVGDALKRAGELFRPAQSATDWELGWMETYARLSGDGAVAETVRAERKRRKNNAIAPDDGAMRPMLVGALTQSER